MTESKQAQLNNSNNTNIGEVTGTNVAVGPNAQAIAHIYQTLYRPLPINLSSLIRPLIRNYASDPFGGRNAELAMLDAFLADPAQNFGLLVATTGLGKTALLIQWIARLKQQETAWRIIFMPISIRYQTASEQITLGILAHSLAEIHNDLEEYRKQDQSSQYLRAIINDYLERPLPDGTQLLLVLDGIDEALGWEVGKLCSVSSQTGLKILISARQQATITREHWREHLGWHNQAVAQLDLQQLNRTAVEHLLKQNELPQAHDPAFVDQFYRVSQGDPLTCNLLLKAVISGQLTTDSLSHRPPGLELFLKDWVETLAARRKTSNAIRELLTLCAAAYGPLTSDDLQALAPQVFEEQATISDAIRDDDIDRFIITVGKHSYVFSHQRLREVFLEEIYPPKDREKLQQRFIDYGNAWYAERSQPLPDYLRQFWISHLRAAGNWQRIQQVLTEIVPSTGGEHYQQPWQAARFTIEGSNTAYLAELDLLWTWAEQHNKLGLMLRCALITASLRSLSGNLTPELLVQLVKIGTPEGKWSPAAALEQIAHMPDPELQTKSLQALIEAEIVLPWQRALEIARSINDRIYRSLALTTLVAFLPPTQHQAVLIEALPNIFSIYFENNRAQTIADLTLLLSLETQQALLAESLQVDLIFFDEIDRIQALIRFVPLFPNNQQPIILAEALLIVLSMSIESKRTELLITLAPFLNPIVFVKLLQTTPFISDVGKYIQDLIAFIPRVPLKYQQFILAIVVHATLVFSDDNIYTHILNLLTSHNSAYQQQEDLDNILQAALSLSDESNRTLALAILVPVLSSNVISDTLLAVRSTNNKDSRIQALTIFLPFLTTEQRQSAISEILLEVRSSNNNYYIAQKLNALAPFLLPEQQQIILAEALQAALSISENTYRKSALNTFTSALPSSQKIIASTNAIQTALSIPDVSSRVESLITLAQLLYPEQQQIVLDKALQEALSIPNELEWSRIEVLIELIPYLPIEQQQLILAEALQATYSINTNRYHVETLITLVPYLPTDQQQTILAKALHATQSIFDVHNRVEILSIFLPFILPTQQQVVLNEALEIALSLPYEYAYIFILRNLVPFLSLDQQDVVLNKAYQTALSIHDQDSRARTLTVLSSFLPSEQQQNVLNEALQVALSISHKHTRALLLRDLTSFFPPEQQHDILAKSLQAVRSIKDNDIHASILRNIIPLLPPEQQLSVLNDALQAAFSLSDEHWRAYALSTLIPLLSLDQQQIILNEVLQAALSFSDEYWRLQVFIIIAPHLAPEQQQLILTQAVQIAHSFSNGHSRAEALSSLIPYLSAEQQQTILGLALQDCQLLSNKWEWEWELKRDEILNTLAPILASKPFFDRLFITNLYHAGRRGRSELLQDLISLTPWLFSISQRAEQPNTIAELAEAIIDVGRCWP